MAIAGYYSETISCQVEVDTIHNRTKFILRCSEDGTVDILCQNGIGNGNRLGIFADRLCHGELIGVIDRQ